MDENPAATYNRNSVAAASLDENSMKRPQHPLWRLALALPRRVVRYRRAMRCVAPRSLADVVACFDDFDARPAGRTEVWLRGMSAPIQLRNGTSDFAVFRQVCLSRQYDLPAVRDAEYILDAGANIGMSSLYFLLRNPRARVVAVEPDAENYAVAAENLGRFADRCRLIHGAVWSQGGTLALRRGTFRDGRHWASQTVPDSPDAKEHVRAYTVDELLREAGFPRFDLLKIDIEGAELQVFRDGSVDFLDAADCCAVECHGKEAREAFRAAAEGHGFALRTSGELTVAERAARR